jgi:hypothetical protein
MEEEWRDVPGFPGYQVSNLGNARSQRRLLKPTPDERGYLKCYPFGRIHRAVLLAFVGPCPPGLEGRHGVGGKLNNRLDNLCYGTHSQNMMDRVEHGTANRGERHGQAKLTARIVATIRYDWRSSNRGLARLYGVSESAVRKARSGETWSCLCP